MIHPVHDTSGTVIGRFLVDRMAYPVERIVEVKLWHAEMHNDCVASFKGIQLS